MKKLVLITVGIVLMLGSILSFLNGTALLALSSIPQNIKISNPNIIVPESVNQNQALSIILGSIISGILGLGVLVFGIMLKIQSSDSN